MENEESDQGVGFDDKFKANNHILFILLRANRIIVWIIRNIILRKVNIFFKNI